MTTTETEPTLEAVAVLETRLVDLEVEAEGLEAGEQQLTKQIAEIHTGGGSKEDLPALMRSRSEAKEARGDVVQAAAVLRTRIAEDLEVASVAAAVQRLKDIRKAHGGLGRVLEADERAVEKGALQLFLLRLAEEPTRKPNGRPLTPFLPLPIHRLALRPTRTSV